MVEKLEKIGKRRVEKDRTERVDLSRDNPKILKQLVNEWNKWANTHYVYPKGK